VPGDVGNFDDRQWGSSAILDSRTLSRIPLDESLRQVWEEADIDFKRDLIKLVVKKIVILPGRTQRLCKINDQTFRFDPSLMQITWEV